MPSNYQNSSVFDAESPTELVRLLNLDQVTTRVMGGPLAGVEPSCLPHLKNVLDLGCGPGGWVLDMAFALPDAEVAGVDISRPMVDYANARARSQMRTNASFGVMDIRQPLDFADGAFDLVNARYLAGVLKREDWPAFLHECLRLLRPGGLVRLTETDGALMTTSPALSQLNLWLMQAMHRMGYGHASDGCTLGIATILPSLLHKAGVKHLQTVASVFDGSYDSPHHTVFLHLCEIAYLQAQPLLARTAVARPEEVEQLYHQMLIEIQRADFRCVFTIRCIIGQKSKKARKREARDENRRPKEAHREMDDWKLR